jgi:hypothetical protein
MTTAMTSSMLPPVTWLTHFSDVASPSFSAAHRAAVWCSSWLNNG